MDALKEAGKTEASGLKGKLGPRAQARLDKLARLGVVTRESEWPRPVVSAKYETEYFLKALPEEAVARANLKKNAVNQRALLDALFEMPEGVSASELRERGISATAIKTLATEGGCRVPEGSGNQGPPGIKALPRNSGSTTHP